jgi:hypothetical protein
MDDSPSRDHLEPLGRPAGDPGDPAASDDGDFATEHDATAVSEQITAGTDDREPESPESWGGMDPKAGTRPY